MKNKGQVEVGTIITIAVMLIIGAIFLQVISQSVGSSTTLATLNNTVITVGADGEDYVFTDYRSLTDVVITNNTDGAAIPSTNYSIQNNQVTNGGLSVVLTVNGTSFESVDWNVSATAQPVTYIADAGSRAVSAIIIIMFVLAILVVALYPVLKNNILS